MHFDISRDSFDKGNHFLRVLLEQGRVPIDADFNEQTSILLHRLHSLTRDLFGDSWGPYGETGFEIRQLATGKPYTIGAGRYYVAGHLVENNQDGIDYFLQEEFPLKTDSKLPEAPFVFYLDVWEREVNDISLPEFKDPALGSLSSASRSRLVWQVRAVSLASLDNTKWTETDLKKLSADDLNDKQDAITSLGQALTSTFARSTGMLAARPISLQDGSAGVDDVQYRGLENQLYRVEIHRSGVPFQPSKDKPDPDPDKDAPYATFKWSRDNGSAVYPIKTWVGSKETVAVQLARTAADDTFSLHLDDWVEYVDDNTVLNGDDSSAGFLVAALFQVTDIDPYDPTNIQLKGIPDSVTAASASFKSHPNHPFLRRWDQKPEVIVDKHDFLADTQEVIPFDHHDFLADTQDVIAFDDHALLVVAANAAGRGFLQLEDGVTIQFSGPPNAKFQRGDFWLIPARESTGLVVWPKFKPDDKPGTQFVPKPMPPSSIEHYYAPLAVVNEGNLIPCRRTAPSDLLRVADQVARTHSESEQNLAVEWNEQVALSTPMAQRRWLIERIKQRLTADEFNKYEIPTTTTDDDVKKLERLRFDFGILSTDKLQSADSIKGVDVVRGMALMKIAKAQDARAIFGTNAPFNDATLDSVIRKVIAAVGELYFLAKCYADVPRTIPAE